MQELLSQLAESILGSNLHEFINASVWIFPAAETVHFMGLTLFMGALLVLDVRGAGFFRRMNFSAVHQLVPVALLAFAFVLLSGITFIFADPERYFVNIAFQLKMLLVVLAGLNAMAFEVFVFRAYRAGNQAVIDSLHTRIISVLSLLFWVMVLILGRSIPYVEY